MEDEKEQAPDAERAAKERQSQAGRRNITEFNASRNGRPALAHGIHTVVNSGGAELPDLPGAREAAERVDARYPWPSTSATWAVQNKSPQAKGRFWRRCG